MTFHEFSSVNSIIRFLKAINRILNIFGPCSYCLSYSYRVCSSFFYIPHPQTSVMMESNKIHIIYAVSDF